MPKLPVKPKLRPLADRLTALQRLLARSRPVPPEWLKTDAQGLKTEAGMPCLPCNDWRTLNRSWRKAMRWTDGLNDSLSVMLASVASTMAVGDQLWLKIIGPPSCGKSTLCEALSVNSRYILAKSTIRGFHSGFKTNDGEDNSLISLLKGKTLVTKDGDTLLKSPNVEQILSEARDIYDSTSRSHYRNQMGKDYTGIRMTWILCGTSGLRCLDQSELGARFLDCVVMEGIDGDLEDEILWRVANRVDRNLAVEVDSQPETQYEPELALAMQLTGGYIDYLRGNAADLLSTIETPEQSLKACVRLGKLVAFMRARPSKLQGETQEREFAARLVSQLLRLAKCLAVVLNRNSVDEQVIRVTKKVALDTARGVTYKLAQLMFEHVEGCESKALALHVNETEDHVRKLLRFLRLIEVAELNVMPAANGARTKQNRWCLTSKFRLLMQDVETI